jgi:DNA-binding beta-propeller fold protein YncE
MALDGDGNLIVADSFNNRIRKIDREGNVTTIAGTGESGDADGYGGPDGGATFAWPFGLAIDDAGSIYVADTENFAIRKITFYKP